MSLREQYDALEEALTQATQAVFRRSSFVLGEEVRAFEAEFAAAHGCSHGVGVGSGTDALQLALRACGVGPGDEVITVANVWVPTACAIYATGAKPVFVDIEPVSHHMNPALIAAAVTPRTRAIVPVHLYGQTADMDAINQIARQHGLRVVEDACQSHAATYRGRPAGSLSDAGCFSFYPTKNLGAYGDGGLVTTRDAEVAASVRSLRNYGEGDQRYMSGAIGINSRLDELQAAMLRVKLRHLDAWTAARRTHAATYTRLLEGCSVVEAPSELPDTEHVYHLYVVRSGERAELRAWLDSQGIGTGVHYPVPVHLQPACADLGYRRGDLPETEKACAEVVSLPIYPELEEWQIQLVVDTINRFPGA